MIRFHMYVGNVPLWRHVLAVFGNLHHPSRSSYQDGLCGARPCQLETFSRRDTKLQGRRYRALRHALPLICNSRLLRKVMCELAETRRRSPNARRT